MGKRCPFITSTPMVKWRPLITSAVSTCVLYWFHRMVEVVWWMVRLALRLHQVL
jgi:hypothetical protein